MSIYHSFNRRQRTEKERCCCDCQCTHDLETSDKGDRHVVNNNPSNTFHPVFNPSITINVFPNTTNSTIGLETFQYMAFAENEKKIYTNGDALKQYGSSDILDPKNIAYMNLFVNGVLQPETIYHVEEGSLTLKSSDTPPDNAPIILLFVVVKD